MVSDTTLEMSLASMASSSGHCYFVRSVDDMGPIATAASVEVQRGNETVTIAPGIEGMKAVQSWYPEAFAWAPRITGSISIATSAVILWIVLRDRRSKLAKTRYRLLLGMSIADVLNSFALVLSSAPIPAGTYGTYGAVGTTATCSAQGFFVQLGFAEPTYSCMLSVYFALVINFRAGERFISRRIEPLMHVFSVLWPLGTAIAGLVLKIFNSSGTMCWIEPYPAGCTVGNAADVECPCTRGVNAFLYQMAFAGVPLFALLSGILASLGCILRAVRRIDRRMRMLNAGGPPSARDARQIKAAAMSTQAYLYIWAFLATYLPPVVMSFAQEFGVIIPLDYHLVLYTLLPLQGFWNFLAFMHPRWKFARSTHPREKRWKVLKLAVVGDPERRRAGRAGIMSALNGEFQPRQFGIGTASMSMRSGQGPVDSSFDYARRQQQIDVGDGSDSYSDSTFEYVESQRRQQMQSSAYYDSECAVDLEFEDEPRPVRECTADAEDSGDTPRVDAEDANVGCSSGGGTTCIKTDPCALVEDSGGAIDMHTRIDNGSEEELPVGSDDDISSCGSDMAIDNDEREEGASPEVMSQEQETSIRECSKEEPTESEERNS